MKARGKACIEKLESRVLLSAWSTVDSFQLSPGASGLPRAMASDNAGNVYAAGKASDSAGVSHAIIREMAGGSGTWTTIEDTTSVPNFRALAVDAKGNLFVSAASISGALGNSPGWMVLERPAGQSAFSVVDQLSGAAECNGLTTDAAGDVFAVGVVSETTTGKKTSSTHDHWVAREWKAGTSGFGTVDDFIGSDLDSNAFGVGIVPSGPSAGIYVVGENWTVGGSYGIANWWARKSTDGGHTWGTVDSFVYGSPTQSSPGNWAYGIAGDLSGNVYVVGHGWSTSSYTNHWIVRKSASGNLNSWSVNDDFQLASSANAGANAIGTDLAGNMYVAGFASDPSGSPSLAHGIVRSNVGGSWATVDDYQGNTGYGDMGLTVDSRGNLYTAGPFAPPSSSASAWVVRSQPAAPTSLSATPDITFPSSQIDLSWTNTAGSDETGFAIYRSTDGINFTAVASVGAGATTFSDTGLAPATTYFYYVIALLNATGASAPSNTASAAT